MWPRWAGLSDQQRSAFRALSAFLEGRMEDRTAVDWALQLKPDDNVQRLALLELIERKQHGKNLAEPWRSAWSLIEESWNTPEVENNASTGDYHAQHRLLAGDRSGALVSTIVQLVAPRLKVKPFSKLHLHYQPAPKRPKTAADLFLIELTSGKVIDADVLKLEDLTDISFLLSLALALDAAVTNGLDIVRRIGRDRKSRLWHVGQIYRVYNVPASERVYGEDEPDAFHRGLAASVKLLHTVVARLVDLSLPKARDSFTDGKLQNLRFIRGYGLRCRATRGSHLLMK